MDYAVPIISGLMFGLLVAFFKHFFIWRPYALGRADGVYARMAISSGVNVLTLLLVFLLRGAWPYSFYATIVAVALGLSGGGRLFSQGGARGKNHGA